jgi:hypothetical protein
LQCTVPALSLSFLNLSCSSNVKYERMICYFEFLQFHDATLTENKILNIREILNCSSSEHGVFRWTCFLSQTAQ